MSNISRYFKKEFYKTRGFYFLLIFIAALAVFVCVSIKKPTISPEIEKIAEVVVAPMPDANSSAFNLDDVEEFTEQELSYLDGINLEPSVKYIRQGIKNYLNNSGTDTQTEGLPNCGFSKFEEYLSGKYVAFQMELAKYGGEIVRVIFRDKPDHIFEAWIYELADGTLDLRSFCSSIMPESEEKAIIKAFGKLLKNDKMAL
ncbi:MAG: hypothetical protein V1902_00620 [Candidatus Falkowbacteria bacterium]